MKIKVEIKVPSQRDYKRMIWELREAVKFAMIEATRKELLLAEEKPNDPKPAVAICVGGRTLPENLHLSPILWVLRHDGWISDGCSITLTPTELEGVTIEL
jgi:hypothetical protein